MNCTFGSAGEPRCVGHRLKLASFVASLITQLRRSSHNPKSTRAEPGHAARLKPYTSTFGLLYGRLVPQTREQKAMSSTFGVRPLYVLEFVFPDVGPGESLSGVQPKSSP